MRFDFCIPTRGAKVPHTPDCLHEIKYDGYRLRVERDGDRVRLITRGGYDWTKRYPWIVEAALKNRQKDPILLPRGRQIVTQQDAGTYITKLPKAEHEAAECRQRWRP